MDFLKPSNKITFGKDSVNLYYQFKLCPLCAHGQSGSFNTLKTRDKMYFPLNFPVLLVCILN